MMWIFRKIAFRSRYYCSGRTVFMHRSHSSSTASDLKGRDLVSFDTYTTSDIHTLLWIALDLKHKTAGHIKMGKSIYMISSNPISKLSMSQAAMSLRSSVAFGSLSDDMKQSMNIELFGKTLSSASDIVFVDSQTFSEEDTEQLASGCTVPVVTVSNAGLSPALCLAELMTLFEKYQYLRRLIISYIGVGSESTLNTYAVLLPKVGMHLRYLISDNIKSAAWEKGVALSVQSSTDFQQKDNLADVLHRTHVISTCPKSEWKLSLKDTEEMDLEWSALHQDPYKGCVLSDEILRSKKCLVWEAVSNLTWIFQAIIAAKTTNYKPSIQRPGFEGVV